MSNDLTLFDNNQLQVPDHIASAFADKTNIERRQTVPTLTYEGKTWTVSLGGEKRRLTRVNAEGDEEPLSVMRVVVLDAAKRRGRTYYEGAYDPSKIGSPKCWSDDGKNPHPSVAEPQCRSCAECPMAAKGSKVTDQGKAIAACSQHRMLAVVPAGKLDSTPLRLKIAITSDYDKLSPDEEAKHWYAYSNYTDFLISRGVQHTAQVVTKIKFDQNVAYPKLFFAADRWLDADETAAVAPVLDTEAVTSLLGGSYSPNGADGTPTKQDAAPAPTPQSAPVEVEEPAPKPKAKAKAVKAEAPTEVEVPDDLSDLIGEWADDD